MANRLPIHRRCLWIAILGVLAFLGRTADVTAEAPMQKTQAPGFYRMMIGTFEVTALFDGLVELDAGLLTNVSETEVHDLLSSRVDRQSAQDTDVGQCLSDQHRLEAGAGRCRRGKGVRAGAGASGRKPRGRGIQAGTGRCRAYHAPARRSRRRFDRMPRGSRLFRTRWFTSPRRNTIIGSPTPSRKCRTLTRNT